MLPQTPRYTLFPYTTLFRSRIKINCNKFLCVLSDQSRRIAMKPSIRLSTECAVELRRENPRNLASRIGEDRKSTRLNSSHVAISYAVFCLKKKNKNIEYKYN